MFLSVSLEKNKGSIKNSILKCNLSTILNEENPFFYSVICLQVENSHFAYYSLFTTVNIKEQEGVSTGKIDNSLILKKPKEKILCNFLNLIFFNVYPKY